MESVAARICREAGGRVTTNVMVRDLDLAAPNMFDARRLEVVVDGLPLFGGVQLAVDTTMVSALHANGEARRGATRTDGVVWQLLAGGGAYLPRVDRPWGTRQVGRVGRRSGRPMVVGDTHIS